MRRWVMAAGLISEEARAADADPRAAENVVAQACELREAINSLLSPELVAESDEVELINRWSQLAPRPQLRVAEPVAVVTGANSLEECLGLIAADAIAVIAAGERVKICRHERCGLRFLDRSRAGGREWCSMQRCGNRAKAARHAARRQGRESASSM